MKVFIYHIYFTNENLTEFIKNNSNNENWPTIGKYHKTLNEWNQKFKQQIDLVRAYSDYVLKEKKKGSDGFIIKIKM